jgi:hypothetical protein
MNRIAVLVIVALAVLAVGAAQRGTQPETLADLAHACEQQSPGVPDQVCVDLNRWTYAEVRKAMEGKK